MINRFKATKGIMLSGVLGTMMLSGIAPTYAFVNEATMACLQAPTRDCALQAALQTAIDEELALEKAAVLISVGQALIGVDQKAQGLQALELAMAEVRTANLSLVTQEKIRSIAPLMALGGDAASALALVQEIQIQAVRDQVLEEISDAVIAQGDLATATVALDQISSDVRAFWRRLDLYLMAPANLLAAVDLLPFVEQVEADNRPLRRYRGLITLGLIEMRRGNEERGAALIAGADALFDSMVSAQAMASMASAKIRAVHKAGLGAEAVDQAFVTTRFPSAAVGRDGMASYALSVGPVEAETGRLASALNRVDAFAELTEKAQYLSTLAPGSADDGFSTVIENLIPEIDALESTYERDSLRLSLIEAAIGGRDTDLAARLVLAIEDDESQAIGLALMAPIL